MIEGRHYAARQSQGARNYQEDEFGFLQLSESAGDQPHSLLAVLADGMGGHKGGAHASAAAVEEFVKAYQASDLPTHERLRAALDSANQRIGTDSHGNPELEGMGCTLVGAAFTEAGLQWVSVGDSPFWLFRGDKLIRLNADHSMAPLLAEQVALGKMSAEDAAHHPQRNALRSAVVGETLPLVDLKQEPMTLEPGDRFVLSSDGLETLSDDEIAAVLRDGADDDPDGLAARLLAAVEARNRKGQDNTTVVIVEPFGPEGKDAAVDMPTIIPARAAKPRHTGRMLTVAIALVALVVAAGGALAWKFGWPPFAKPEPAPPTNQVKGDRHTAKPRSGELLTPDKPADNGAAPGVTEAPRPRDRQQTAPGGDGTDGGGDTPGGQVDKPTPEQR